MLALEFVSSCLYLENENNTKYMNVNIFKLPDRLFTYHEGQQALSSNQAEGIH
jgi:hypothetical protein